MDNGRDGTPTDTGDRGDQSRALGFRPGSHDVKEVTVKFADGQIETWLFTEKPARYKATNNHRTQKKVKDSRGVEQRVWTDEYYNVAVTWTVP